MAESTEWLAGKSEKVVTTGEDAPWLAGKGTDGDYAEENPKRPSGGRDANKGGEKSPWLAGKGSDGDRAA